MPHWDCFLKPMFRTLEEIGQWMLREHHAAYESGRVQPCRHLPLDFSFH
jgi:hypothetical protein